MRASLRATLGATTRCTTTLCTTTLFAATLVVTGCTAPVADPTAPATLEHHVRFLAELSPQRDTRHPAALLRAADYIAAELTAAGGTVERQEFAVRGQTYHNVCALFGPAARDAERIVVGAHYDTAFGLPGADDNASGVSGLLALGHLLGRAELALPVELVAYTLEEPPHFDTNDMGSVHHARRLAATDVRVRGMICLEMIGYYRDEEGSQRFPHESLARAYPSTGNFIAVVGRTRDRDLVRDVHDSMAAASPLPVEQLVAPVAIPGIDLSDHRSYWSAGFEAVMVTDTAFFRNPNYHDATDTPETLDYGRMAQAVQGIFAAVVDLANDT